MKKILIFLCITPIYAFSQDITFANNDEKIDFCKILVEHISQMMPIRTDKISYLNSVVCTPTNPPTFLYDNVIELDSKTNLEVMLASIAINNAEQKNIWCTDPEKVMILENYKVQQRYRDVNGVFLNAREFTIDECN